MNVLKAKKSEVGIEIEKRKFEPESEHTWLALFLLNEKMKDESYWKPYLNSLPEHYNNFPHFFGKKTNLAKLKGSFIIDFIKSRKLDLLDDFKTICENLEEFKKKLRNYVLKKNKK